MIGANRLAKGGVGMEGMEIFGGTPCITYVKHLIRLSVSLSVHIQGCLEASWNDLKCSILTLSDTFFFLRNITYLV